jgi:hypothetical protein
MRIYGLTLAVCLAGVYCWDISPPGPLDRSGQPKGGDFVHLYTIGLLAREGHGEMLYDMPAQTRIIHEITGAENLVYLPLYGPQVALLFAPLSRLSLSKAFLIWVLINIVIYALCCRAVGRRCAALAGQRITILILALAFPPFFALLVWGQTSGIALGLFTLAWLALRSRHSFAAGLALGMLVFKPQLGIAAALLFLLNGEWVIVLGALVLGGAQVAAGWWYFGTAVMKSYFLRLTAVDLGQLEPRPWATHSLRAFWAMLVPYPGPAFALYLLSAAILFYFALQAWRNAREFDVRFSSLVLASILLAPHLGIYDLVLLMPVLLLLSNAVRQQHLASPAIPWLLASCYVFPLLGGIAHWARGQLSVPAMAALLVVVSVSARSMKTPALAPAGMR